MSVIRYIETGEAFVGASHPSLDDTLNRAVRDVITGSGLDPDVDFEGFASTGALSDLEIDLAAAVVDLEAAIAAAVSILEAADAALTAAIAAKVASVAGTPNRVTIGGTATAPTVDIAADYAGQASITTLGTIGGALKSSHATAGIGYAAGAGGTVIQATSKGTPVTINKVCGMITMHNAELNNQAIATFAVNNTCVEVGDMVVVALGNGGSVQQYQVWVDYTDGFGAGGAFLICLRNISGLALGESVKVHFFVLKKVNS